MALNAGDVRLVNDTTAEMFDGTEWVVINNAVVTFMQMGADGSGGDVVVVRVGTDTPVPATGVLVTDGRYSGSVSISGDFSAGGGKFDPDRDNMA